MTTPAGELPRLLYISPVYPDTQGNGLAMRAGMFLEAFAQQYRIALLVIPMFNALSPTADSLIAATCAERFEISPPKASRFVGLRRRLDRRPLLLSVLASLSASAHSTLAARRFDLIHAQRLYTAPLALGLRDRLVPGGRMQLDLDDVESVTHARLAGLYRTRGRSEEAAIERSEADRYSAAEQDLLPRFERVWVCSEADAEKVKLIGRIDPAVIPNAVRLPEEQPRALTTHPFTFLFVGNLGYLPNDDAVRYFGAEILPLIRRQTRQRFLVRIVGGGASHELKALSKEPEVRLAGHVTDLGREYAEAGAVIVPIRAGGGTRIKVLEAFANHRPVVSTSIGMEGIEAEPGRDLLIGDAPQFFADACVRLMADETLRTALSSSAASLVARDYSQNRINQLIAGQT